MRSSPCAPLTPKSASEPVADCDGSAARELVHAEPSLAGELSVGDAHDPVAGRDDGTGVVDREYGPGLWKRSRARNLERRCAGAEHLQLIAIEGGERARLWVE